jgi:hypothetical protein
MLKSVGSTKCALGNSCFKTNFHDWHWNGMNLARAPSAEACSLDIECLSGHRPHCKVWWDMLVRCSVRAQRRQLELEHLTVASCVVLNIVCCHTHSILCMTDLESGSRHLASWCAVIFSVELVSSLTDGIQEILRVFPLPVCKMFWLVGNLKSRELLHISGTYCDI